MDIQQQLELKPYNTLSLPSLAEHFVSVDSVDALQQALQQAADNRWPITLLGSGSNIVLADDVPGLVIHIAIPGIELLAESDNSVQLCIGAGEDWHQLVQYCLQQGWYGLENLSLIPGTVGAAPVQNIGAYGVELADQLLSVDAVELCSGQRQTLNCKDCQFGYRDSIFKGELRGRVAIVSVTLELSKQPQLQLQYPALKQAVARLEKELGRQQVTPQQVSELVCRIRQSKLPDPAQIANAGSFFKNPVVEAEAAKKLQLLHPEMVAYPVSGGQAKLAAGWLIEQAGWKGRAVGDIAVHDKQALVLINCGNGTGQQLLAVASEIAHSVQQLFGVALEIEPRVLPETV